MTGHQQVNRTRSHRVRNHSNEGLLGFLPSRAYESYRLKLAEARGRRRPAISNSPNDQLLMCFMSGANIFLRHSPNRHLNVHLIIA
jgi:hypothetical protein